MADLNEFVIEEADKQGDKMLVDDFVNLIERHESSDEPGVEIDRVAAYAEALNDRRGHDSVGPEELRSLVEDRLTDSRTWVETGALYELSPGRVSVYPSNWHEELGGETDITRHIEFIEADIGDANFTHGGPGPGVPEQLLVDVAAVVGGMEIEEARAEIERLRDEGVVSENVDQHPNPRVRIEGAE